MEGRRQQLGLAVDREGRRHPRHAEEGPGDADHPRRLHGRQAPGRHDPRRGAHAAGHPAGDRRRQLQLGAVLRPKRRSRAPAGAVRPEL